MVRLDRGRNEEALRSYPGALTNFGKTESDGEGNNPRVDVTDDGAHAVLIDMANESAASGNARQLKDVGTPGTPRRSA